MVGREDAAAHWIIWKELLFMRQSRFVAACDWTIIAYATLSRDFVAHSRDKIARENCRRDIGLTA